MKPFGWLFRVSIKASPTVIQIATDFGGGFSPPGGDDIVAEHVKIYLGMATAGGVAAMFKTLTFFLIAVLLTLGIIVDSLWGRFQRR